MGHLERTKVCDNTAQSALDKMESHGRRIKWRDSKLVEQSKSTRSTLPSGPISYLLA